MIAVTNFMPAYRLLPVVSGFLNQEPCRPADERPETHSFRRAATESLRGIAGQSKSPNAIAARSSPSVRRLPRQGECLRCQSATLSAWFCAIAAHLPIFWALVLWI